MNYYIYDGSQLKEAFKAAMESMEAIARDHGEEAHLDAAKAFINNSTAFEIMRSRTPVHARNIKSALSDYFEIRPDIPENVSDDQLTTARLVSAWAAAYETQIKKFDNPWEKLHPALAHYGERSKPAARI